MDIDSVKYEYIGRLGGAYIQLFDEFIDEFWEFASDKDTMHGHLLKQELLLGNLWVYVATDYEDYWDNKIHDVHLKNSLKQNGSVLLGFMIVTDKRETDTDEKYAFVDFIDTRIRGLEIASKIMLEYEIINETTLLPKEPIYSAKEYWKARIEYWKTKLSNRVLSR